LLFRLAVPLGAAAVLGACSAPVASPPPEPSPAPAGQVAVAQTSAPDGQLSTTQRSVLVGRTSRSYLAIGPWRHRPGLPLLVMLHGRGITAQQESARTGFLGYAQRGLADLVYPMGIAQSWDAGHGCCGQAAKTGVNDIGFLDNAISDASHYFESDNRRIYLVGYSNGAKLAFQYVCDRPHTFAALATYGAVPLAGCDNPAGPPISTLMAAGSADPLVKSEHSATSATAALNQAVDRRRGENACPPTPAVTHTGPLTLSIWSGCQGGTEVGSASYAGITHYWPVSAPTKAPFTTPVGPQAAAAPVMWDFLTRHQLA
jgi:polyhydroxybutyrate depolymerase